MAKLSSFRVDSRKVEEGDWVNPSEEYDDLQIKTRGFTDAYTDARAAKLRRIAQRYSNDVARIPASVSREVTIECLIQYVLQDVRNIVDDSGKPVTFADFCAMLRNPDYADLVIACLKAAAIVGLAKTAELEESEKNSPTP